MEDTIIQWNINGFDYHFEFLKKLIHDQNPMVICVQETNFKDHDCTNLKNYKTFHKNRTSYLSASGGAAIYVRDHLECTEFQLNTNLEAVAVVCTIASKRICICSIYIPDSYGINKNEIESIIELLPKPFIMLGDLNCRSTIWGCKKTDNRGKIMEKVLAEQDVVLLNTDEPTYFSSRNGSLSSLDLSICSAQIADVLEWKVLDDTYDSDHFPTAVTIENCSTLLGPIYLPRWIMKKANWHEYQQYIENKIGELRDPLICKSVSDINSIVNDFENIILDAANNFIPKTSGAPVKRNLPWWNEDCAQAVKEAKKARNKYKKRNTFTNKVLFKMKKAIARRTIKTSKRNSWIVYLSSLNKNTPSEQMWNKFKSITGIHKQTKITHIATSDDSTTSNPLEIANLLAEMFAKNSSDANFSEEFLRHKIQTEADEENLNESESNEKSNSINSEITLSELQETLNNCKNTSAGPDGIPNIFIKNLPETGIKYILRIFNCIWTHNIFPDKWHEATVIPIPKAGKNSKHKESYRPISLTCCMCKLMEKIINNRLKWYLESNNVISPFQHGFRQFHSTVDSLATIENCICEAFINKQHLVAVALDMEKAYDMLWKHRIIKILRKHQVVGNMLNFAKNYLKNRSVRVRVNGHLSEKYKIENGVPQGGVISVTFFLLAINEITQSIQAPVKCSFYADDGTILLAGKNLKTSEKILQNTLNQLQIFSNQTGFKFSKSKTTVTIFSKSKTDGSDIELYLDNQKLNILNEVKILGLTFDTKLTWIPHLYNLKKECYKRLNIMKTLASKNWGADQDVLLKTYNALIQAKIDYGSIIYDSASDHRLQILSPIQNAGARIATGAFRTSPIDSILAEANVLPLNLRRKKLCLRYAVSTISTLNNDVAQILQSNNSNNLYAKNKSYPRPLKIRVTDYLHEIGLTIPNTITRQYSNTPPWTLKVPKIVVMEIKKNNCHPTTLKHMFQTMINEFSDHVHIYTDAAKISKATGCAVLTKNQELLFKLPDSTSVFTSEAMAILKALEYVEKGKLRKTVILSDSLSAISAIRNKKSKNSLIQDIILKYNEITTKDNNTDITISWIPSHVGIEANEKVDRLAKIAALSKQPTHHISLPTCPEEWKKSSAKEIYENWDRQWQGIKLQKPHLLRNSIFDKNPALSFNRKDQVIINRLRIGHTNLTHLHLINKEENKKCNSCNTGQSVKHIIIDCPLFENARKKHKVTTNLVNCLSDEASCNKIIAFLKDINVYQLV